MSTKRLSIAAGTLAVLVVLVVGLLKLSPSSSPAPLKLTVAQMRASLAGSPPQLAALHAQANEVLGGGLSALRKRLQSLHGEPLVINKWASWCEPCRAEFAVFQRVSLSQGRRVAFIGIDSGDASVSNATDFLRSYPVSYPSFYDHSGQAGLAVTDSTFTPVTVFYDTSGRRFIYQGPFASAAKLEADIRRYALDG